MNNFLLKNFKPNFTFLNVVDYKNMKKRLRIRKKLNRYDMFNLKFYKKVQAGFVKIYKNKKNKFMIINSNLEINLNQDIIKKQIDKLIN